jgi:hypothetical protein
VVDEEDFDSLAKAMRIKVEIRELEGVHRLEISKKWEEVTSLLQLQQETIKSEADSIQSQSRPGHKRQRQE